MPQTATTAQGERKAATLDDVWALMREVGEKQKENAAQLKEHDRQMEERRKETDRQIEEHDRQMEERRKETDRQMEERRKEVDRQIEELRKETNKTTGELGRRFGAVIEHLIAPNLIKKLNALKFDFRISSPNRKYYDSNHQEIAEVDVLLENTNLVMAVEVKSKLLASHVQDHIERMDILRAYADEHDDRRVWLGAVGGALLATDARKAALKAGFYLIEQSGDTVMIVVPEGFKPKEWTFRMT
jgi:chromosome segregation ATPase